MGFIKSLRNKYSNNNCYTIKSRKNEIYLVICGDIGAARITTPHMSEMVEVTEEDYKSNLTPIFTKAYKLAVDAGDQNVADEVHAIRQVICN